jgi:hypothetical protein
MEASINFLDNFQLMTERWMENRVEYSFFWLPSCLDAMGSLCRSQVLSNGLPYEVSLAKSQSLLSAYAPSSL